MNGHWWTRWAHIPWGCMKFSYSYNTVELSTHFQMPLELARKIIICQFVSIVSRLVLQKFKHWNTVSDKRATYHNKYDDRYCVVYRIPEHCPLGETNHLKNTTPSAKKNMGFQKQTNRKAPILKELRYVSRVIIIIISNNSETKCSFMLPWRCISLLDNGSIINMSNKNHIETSIIEIHFLLMILDLVII